MLLDKVINSSTLYQSILVVSENVQVITTLINLYTKYILYNIICNKHFIMKVQLC